MNEKTKEELQTEIRRLEAQLRAEQDNSRRLTQEIIALNHTTDYYNGKIQKENDVVEMCKGLNGYELMRIVRRITNIYLDGE